MTQAAEAAPTQTEAAPPQVDESATQLAELREGLADKPAANDANEAAATEGGDKPAEPEKPKESPPKLIAKALEIQDKANAQIAEARQLKAQAQREMEEARALKSELDSRKKSELDLGAAIRKDPLSAFDRLGFSPNDLARWLMEDDGQRAQRVRSEEENAKKSAVDDETKKELEELKKWRAEQQQREIEQRTQSAKASFVSYIDQHADKYPDIALEDPEELAEVMWDLGTRHWHATGGQVPTFEQIATHMQKVAAEKRAKREERLKQRSGQRASAASSESHQTPRENGQPASPGPRSPKTLSNAAASERASGPRELSQEELDDECRRELGNLWG